MESKASHLQPKRSKFLMQNSCYKIPILPEELINEIILNLSVKSLLRFKCVSKLWYYLISSRKFVNDHLSISTNNKDCSHHRLIVTYDQPDHINLTDCSVSFLLYDSYFGSIAKENHLDYPMKNPEKSVLVFGSVDGLICFSISRDFIIWNPSIKKFKKFRDSRFIGYFIWYGFGYDKLHDDYKVFGYCTTHDRSEIRIYSSKMDSWRIIVDDRPYVGFCRKSNGIFVNGKLYWAHSPSKVGHTYNSWVIVSIDLTDMKWGKVEKPSYGEGDFDLTICVGVLKGDLSVLCISESGQTDVWIMKDYGVRELWTKMYTINVNPPPDYDHKYRMGLEFYDFSPFFCISNEGEFLFEYDKSTFMIYDTKDDSMRYHFGVFSEVTMMYELQVKHLVENYNN